MNTKFTEEIKPGDLLKIQGVRQFTIEWTYIAKFVSEIRVKQVNNDLEIVYDADYIEEKAQVQLSYKVSIFLP